LMVLGWTLWLHRRHYDILHVYQLTLLALPTALVCRLNGKAMVIVVCSANSGKVARSQNKASLVAGPLVATLPWLQVEVDAKNFGDLKDLERLGKPVVQLTRSLLQSIGASVIVLSSRMQRYLTEQDFHLPGTHRIPNGVDITRFTPPRISLDARAQVVVCISRLSYEKGIDVLLQAWHLVHKQAPQARLIIVGGGPIQARLERLAQALDNLGSVEFAGAQSDIQAQLHRGSLAVLPSRWEGMPNAVLEAMACGMPCVATRVSGSEDIILHGVNGLLVEPEDYQGMAQALLTLLRDPGLVQKYGQAARATIEQHYSLEDITDTYIELYRSIGDHSWQIAEDIPSPEVYHPPL
jgi:glycosyltransferase involved in cell wall biosynthesis